jgi:hypothetical protein
VDIIKKGTKYVLAFDPIKELKNKWRGKFKDDSTTMEYLDEIRGPAN